MRYRHRTARRYLLAKKRNHAAVTAKHITKTHRHKLRLVMLVKGLDNHFADPLTGSHNIRGVHRFVGGDHDKTLYAAHGRRLGRLKGAEYIILYGLCRAVLHQRHMLMGRRMINDVWTVFGKNIVHSVGIAHGCNQYHQIQIRKFQL